MHRCKAASHDNSDKVMQNKYPADLFAGNRIWSLHHLCWLKQGLADVGFSHPSPGA
jgi:hypothetical protein